jgi:hypothetical protein
LKAVTYAFPPGYRENAEEKEEEEEEEDMCISINITYCTILQFVS